MKFGKVVDPEKINFTLTADHPDTEKVLLESKGKNDHFEVCVGCAKWNKTDLKGFYPKGTKDELTYYSSQFNSIEMNATFYKFPDENQVSTWAAKTPDHFKFFPKIPQTVSHFKRLNNIKQPLEDFCNSISHFEEKLGMVFLQMPANFHPKYLDRVNSFVDGFPKEIPFAIEMRHKDWFADKKIFDDFYHLLKINNVTNIIVDTAGRRDMLHMRLSSPTAFIRYVGANTHSDYSRLDEWIEKISDWRSKGLQSLYFFVHQNMEKESPLLAAYFTKKLNKKFKLKLKIPATLD